MKLTTRRQVLNLLGSSALLGATASVASAKKKSDKVDKLRDQLLERYPRNEVSVACNIYKKEEKKVEKGKKTEKQARKNLEDRLIDHPVPSEISADILDCRQKIKEHNKKKANKEEE
ncbi:hypothetical protein [Halorhabdus rudnickae]|uniref:hypothetical protein n=1 Tax=Halorhabdus rudnickae TaxID=1775544 RepID=UPI0010824EAC|nr:hypothetical protein [Halorhabdus rudnickae]